MGLNLDTLIEINGKKTSARELLYVDQTDLVNEFAAQAARYVYFAVLADHAGMVWRTMQDVRKQAEAEAFVDYKNDLQYIPPGSRVVSDGLANTLVQSDDACIEARKDEVTAQHTYHLMLSLARAFEQRANMLQSMGTHLRHEADMDGMAVRNDDPGAKLRRRRSLAG